MISLRVSEEEYVSLKQVYRNHGARSLSDFARLAMVRVAGFDGTANGFASKLKSLDTRVNDLEARFARLERS